MSLIAELKRRNGQNVVVTVGTVGFRVASLTGFPAFPVPSIEDRMCIGPVSTDMVGNHGGWEVAT